MIHGKKVIYFTGKKKVKFGYRVLIGMALGAIVGLTLGQTTTDINGVETSIAATIRPVGQLYIRLLQMIVIPLVLTAIIKSFTSIESTGKVGKIAVRSFSGY